VPRELVAVAPSTPVLRPYEEPPLGPREVRVRTEFASPKHGTERLAYRGLGRGAALRYDPEWGCLRPREAADAAPFPRPLGNMAVGVVTETGTEVTRFRPGDRVFGHLRVRETHTVDEWRVDSLPAGVAPETAVCLDPAVMALTVRDAPIRLGDRVAVFGLGAIGLLAVQLARLGGADVVVAVDPIAVRRAAARRFGADHAIAPGEDAGLAVRDLTRPHARPQPPGPPPAAGPLVVGGFVERPMQWANLGVDVAVEASGAAGVLHDAARATVFGGTVCLLSFYGYGVDATGVRLGEEFQLNRLRLVACRAESLPTPDTPAWSLDRLAQTALRWLASGRLKAEGIVSPVVPFEASAEAYRDLDANPEAGIKLGIRFD
jgi:threonine dehydrogenase-like Zn-dependent dehydrogenase